MKRNTPDHPKTVMLMLELEKVYAAHKRKSAFGGKTEAVGLLEALWDWASKYAIQGNIGKWPDEAIAAGVGWKWSAIELTYALVKSQWVDRVDGPARLVLHDIQDHATNGWRQNLENAGLTWWDGSPPRRWKLQTNSKKSPTFGDNSPQAQAQAQAQAQLEKKTSKEPAASGAPAEGTLFDSSAPSVKRWASKKHADTAMTAEQRDWFAEYLSCHPKNTIQLKSAAKLFADKVKTQECFDFIMTALRREAAGETQYMEGPCNWLASHLALYANGVSAATPIRPTPTTKQSKTDEALELARRNLERRGSLFA